MPFFCKPMSYKSTKKGTEIPLPIFYIRFCYIIQPVNPA